MHSVYIHLLHELTTECVDDAGYGRSLALADEVEVEHTLHGSRLKTAAALSVPSLQYRAAHLRQFLLDETSCLWVEKCVFWVRAHWSARRSESLDVIVRFE